MCAFLLKSFIWEESKMKQTLLIITSLMLVVGFSDAQTYKGMRFNDDGSKSFETYKESKGRLEFVKLVSWH